jgi:hypothetical protein
LLAIFFELAFDGLQSQGVLAGGITIAGAEIGAGFSAEVALFAFELTDLGHEALAQAGVGSQALVILRNLSAKVFGFDLQQGLRILFFEAGNEQSKKAANEICEASPHGVDSCMSRSSKAAA